MEQIGDRTFSHCDSLIITGALPVPPGRAPMSRRSAGSAVAFLGKAQERNSHDDNSKQGIILASKLVKITKTVSVSRRRVFLSGIPKQQYIAF